MTDKNREKVTAEKNIKTQQLKTKKINKKNAPQIMAPTAFGLS